MRFPRRIRIVLGSLRARALALLAGSLLLVVIAAGALVWGVGRADYYLDRATKSERQLELLILLSGRVSDYAIAILDAVQEPSQGRERLAAATSQANAVFDLLEKSIESQVELLTDIDEKNAEATESLGVARMRGMLRQLDQQVYGALESNNTKENAIQYGRAQLTVFGISFTPLLAQAIERERREAATARVQMGELRHELTNTAAVIVAFAVILGAALYFLALKPITVRLRETFQGMAALTEGDLGKRLAVRGHDELTRVMTQFNRMAASFARRQRQLTQAQDQLHETIEAKTSELSKANERLNAIDQNRRRFFTDISHELRTPLTVIRGEAEMTLRHSKNGLDGDTRQSLETIAARAIRLHKRVDDMLRVARSESGRIELALADVDLGQAIAAAAEDVLPLARQKKIDIILSPDCRTPHLCKGDKDWLRQIFAGLLANAVKYSNQDTKIAVGCRREGGDVVVEVSDQGIGLDRGELKSVFARFERGSTAVTGRESGHGVGLALAKWVIAEHGGNIHLESPARLWKDNNREKRGLTVLVSLPAIKAAADTG